MFRWKLCSFLRGAGQLSFYLTPLGQEEPLFVLSRPQGHAPEDFISEIKHTKVMAVHTVIGVSCLLWGEKVTRHSTQTWFWDPVRLNYVIKMLLATVHWTHSHTQHNWTNDTDVCSYAESRVATVTVWRKLNSTIKNLDCFLLFILPLCGSWINVGFICRLVMKCRFH